MRLPGLKPGLTYDAYAALEAPLFHGGAGGIYFNVESKARAESEASDRSVYSTRFWRRPA
jgi:hypothetical protein